MTLEEALGVVLEKAGHWADEYGFAVPEEATLVDEAINVIEKEKSMLGTI